RLSEGLSRSRQLTRIDQTAWPKPRDATEFELHGIRFGVAQAIEGFAAYPAVRGAGWAGTGKHSAWQRCEYFVVPDATLVRAGWRQIYRHRRSEERRVGKEWRSGWWAAR